MKRVIKASAYEKQEIMKSDDGMFTLFKEEGESIYDTHWTGLTIVTDGSAEQNVIEIRLVPKKYPRLEDGPVTYTYKGTYVAHGMNGNTDTLDETEQYISDLQSAVKFARQVEEYLPKWNKEGENPQESKPEAEE